MKVEMGDCNLASALPDYGVVAVCGLCHKLIWHDPLIWHYCNLAKVFPDYEIMI